MFDQLPKRYQTKGSNPTKARKDVTIRPAQKGQCQKGSKWVPFKGPSQEKSSSEIFRFA